MTDAVSENGSAPTSRRRWAAAALVAVALWRMVWPSPVGMWRDWILILSLYGLTACLIPRTPARSSLAVAVMAYLLGIYVHGQLPYVLAVLGVLP